MCMGDGGLSLGNTAQARQIIVIKCPNGSSAHCGSIPERTLPTKKTLSDIVPGGAFSQFLNYGIATRPVTAMPLEVLGGQEPVLK